MTSMAQTAREANKAKAIRMTQADPHTKVDASSWRPEEMMNGGEKNMPAPINPKAYKAGGAVHGEKAHVRADRKGRAHKDTGGPLAGANDPRRMATQMMMNAANQAPVAPSLAVPAAASGRKSPLRMGLKKGGHADAAEDKAMVKKMVKADCRTGRKHGGRTGKGKTNINIVIAQPHSGGQPPMPGMPVARPPVPPPSVPLGGAPNMPPPSMGAGAMPPMMPGGAPMMPRKHGGRANYPIDAGSGGGQGRIEKMRAYGLKQGEK